MFGLASGAMGLQKSGEGSFWRSVVPDVSNVDTISSDSDKNVLWSLHCLRDSYTIWIHSLLSSFVFPDVGPCTICHMVCIGLNCGWFALDSIVVRFGPFWGTLLCVSEAKACVRKMRVRGSTIILVWNSYWVLPHCGLRSPFLGFGTCIIPRCHWLLSTTKFDTVSGWSII